MFVSAIHGISLREDDKVVLDRLARVRVPLGGQASRIGLVNERGQLCRIIVCSVEGERPAVIAALQELGFAPVSPREHPGFMQIESVFGKT